MEAEPMALTTNVEGTSVPPLVGGAGSFEVAGRPEREAFVYLLAHSPIPEYLGFATTSLDTPDQAVLMNDWRAATEHMTKLASDEAGIADNAVVMELPEAMADAAKAVSEDAVFRAAYSAMPTSVGIIDLRQVVVHQKGINLGQIARLRRHLDAAKETDLVGFCVGSDVARPPVRSHRVGPNAFRFTSPSNDLRPLEPVLLMPEQVTGHTVGGRVERYLALPIGYGINALSVVRVNGRLILSNGSHRAYTLMERGLTLVPAVIQIVGSLQELAVVCPPVSTASEPYLASPRPPMLRDYFNSALTRRFERSTSLRQVKAGFGAEIEDVA